MKYREIHIEGYDELKPTRHAEFRYKIKHHSYTEIVRLLRFNNPTLNLTERLYFEFHDREMQNSPIFACGPYSWSSSKAHYESVTLDADFDPWCWENNTLYRYHHVLTVITWAEDTTFTWAIKAAVIEFKANIELMHFKLRWN